VVEHAHDQAGKPRLARTVEPYRVAVLVVVRLHGVAEIDVFTLHVVAAEHEDNQIEVSMPDLTRDVFGMVCAHAAR
jgi:hypothetical protein